jgi:predicted nucleic acid-binding protein
LYRQLRQKRQVFVTSNYIIAELVSLLISPLRIPRSSIISFVNDLRKTSFVEIVHIDVSLDRNAWELFAKRLDKNWSLVDCSSFVIMHQQGIREGFTSDHHFEQAGFTCMLK